MHVKKSQQALRKLLIIDDDPKLLMSYRDLLLPYGFEIFTASDGQKAIPIVEQHPDIMLVILDLMMPAMDGREWLRWFRTQRKDPAVIIISAYKISEEENLQPSAFLEKPFTPTALLRKVRQLLDGSRGHARSALAVI